jgi:hypothetical protein
MDLEQTEAYFAGEASSNLIDRPDDRLTNRSEISVKQKSRSLVRDGRQPAS